MKESEKVFSLKLIDAYDTLIQSIIAVSEAYLYDARLDDALNLLACDVVKNTERELSFDRQIRLQYQQAKLLRYKGYCDYDHNLYDTALETLFHLEEMTQMLDNPNLKADVLDLIGEIMQSKYGFSDAHLDIRLQYFENGLKLRQETDNKRGCVESLFHIGCVYQQNKTDLNDIGRHKALTYFEQAYRLADEYDYTWEKGHIARHMAYVYSQWGKWDTAFELHQEFLQANLEAGFKLYLSPAYLMMSLAYLMKKEMILALQHGQDALKIAKSLGSAHFQADALCMLGTIANANNDQSLALKYYQEALAFAEPIKFNKVIHLAGQGISKIRTSTSK